MNQTQNIGPNLRDIRAAARKATDRGGSHQASVHVQITGRAGGNTASGDPYLELSFADCSACEKIRIWKETQAYKVLEDYPQMTRGTCVQIDARWKINTYGLVAEAPELRALDPAETELLFASEASAVSADQDFKFIFDVFKGIGRGPFGCLADACFLALSRHSEAFRRAAAAHGVHHAFRGGLLQHTASMLSLAVDLCGNRQILEVEPAILYAGVLFHDLGKIYETDYEARGFTLAPTRYGSLVGHICAGLHIFLDAWAEIVPSHLGNDALRDYVAHCIVAHHGCKSWGSPVEPASAEALLLHHLDMIDAGMEKLRKAWFCPETVCEDVVAAAYPMRGSVAVPFAVTDAAARLMLRHALGGDQEEAFCQALVTCGIISELRDFSRLTASVLETAVRRWDDLFAAVPSLPASAPKVTFR